MSYGIRDVGFANGCKAENAKAAKLVQEKIEKRAEYKTGAGRNKVSYNQPGRALNRQYH